jgi:D-glycero-D-manno-heptose 1,7-bisphosphate phosphatase
MNTFTSLRFTISEPEPVLGRPVVFLDRDGVINQSADYGKYISSLDEFVFKLTSVEAIKSLLRERFYVVVVTNQAGIGREMISLETLDKIHLKLVEETRVGEKHIQAVYICPHKREEHCICRKPNLGLFRRASAELEIDLRTSYLVGDSESDIIAGTHTGCTTIQIKDTTSVLTRIAPQYVVANLGEAVTKILELEGRKIHQSEYEIE